MAIISTIFPKSDLSAGELAAQAYWNGKQGSHSSCQASGKPSSDNANQPQPSLTETPNLTVTPTLSSRPRGRYPNTFR